MAKDKVTAKQKAQRQQHRKDHYTDADRSFNGKGQKARRAGRQENFNAQGNESAADFDFDQHGKGHVSGQEISHLRKQGSSREDIMSAARAGGGELGGRVEKKFARWEAKAKAKAASGQQGAEPINPEQPANEAAPTPTQTPTPAPTQTPAPTPAPTQTPPSQNTNGPENTQEQTVVQDNDQTSTVVGDNNTVDQNQDNSVSQQGSNNKAMTGGDQMAHAAVMPADYAASGAYQEAQKLAGSYMDTIRPGTTTNMDTAIKNTQQQDISQDNDQTSTITGDNNTVWQQQDNSIRQYGGDNRSFVYNGGNSGVDTPVSAMTMSGFLGVDDSPAAQASFHDLHNTLNSDAQKKYSGSGMRIAGMFTGFDARGYDPAELESNIENSSLESYDRATLAKNDTFGDTSAYRGTLSDYKFGAEPATVDYDKDDKDDDDDD